MSKKIFYSVLLITSMLLILSACGNESGSEDAGSEENVSSDSNQEITFATISDIVGLSPIDTNDAVSSNMNRQIYETLFLRDAETMEIEPLLAESYENPDDTTWVIQLREGITFHDGTEFNAEAVKYTFDEFLDPDRGAPRASLLEPIESVEVEDEYTVILNTRYPYGPLLAALSHSNASIVSPTADQEGDINKENPSGTGPFMFDERIEGDRVTLTKNPDYWQGEAQLETITMRVVPEYSTAISMLETGEVDFIESIPAEHLSRVENIADVEVMTKEGTPVRYLGFNMNEEPYNDLFFRQAVAHAIDTQAWVDQLNGQGIKNDGLVGPQVFGYKDEASDAGYEYDPEKAKQMLEESGYAGREITLLASPTGSYMNMAEVVQAQLIEVGLDVSIESMEWGTFLDTTQEGNYEMMFNGWTNSTADGSEHLYPNLHSDNMDASNRVNYNNPEFDKLVDESRQIVDQDERLEILHEANMLAMEDAVWITMHHEVVSLAYHDSVHGIELTPTQEWSLYNAYRE